MNRIDPSFIQDIEHRPKLTLTEAEGIPLIDLEGDENLDYLVAEIGHACQKWGFFQVINSGVKPEKRRNLETAARKFFMQSRDEKMKVRRDAENPLGFYDTEYTKNVKDWKEVFDLTVVDPTLMAASPLPDNHDVAEWTNRWPQNVPELRSACEEYIVEMQKLSYKLLQLICLSLSLPKNRLNDYFKDETSFLRLNRYPPCPVPDVALGVGRHKDATALTILAQDDVGGLQVKRKSDGEWIQVKPIPDAYVINVGAVLQVWSNDKYESVEHRATVNSEKERFSIPFFLNPSHYTIVKPLEELVNDQNSAKYKPYSWGKFLATKKRSNFMKLNVEDIQIHHFKVQL